MDNTFSYFYPQDKGKKKKSVEKKEKTAASSGKTAYLSFDDGPSEQTVRILDVLKRYGIKGTFLLSVRIRNLAGGCINGLWMKDIRSAIIHIHMIMIRFTDQLRVLSMIL